MKSPFTHRQIVPDLSEDKPPAGARGRDLSKATTVEVPRVGPPPSAPSVIRRIQIERLGPPPGATANDVEETSFLINTGEMGATSYRFVAPRIGRRR